MWLRAITDTIHLIVLTNLIALSVGLLTAVAAWKSNHRWAYLTPLLILAVPPWLLTYYISEAFGYMDPWIGASLSLGVCCSVYPHSIISSSLANRANKDHEMLKVVKGNNIKVLLLAIYPSLKISIVPSIAIIAAEVIADFGVSNFYGLNTVTMLTYTTWATTWNFDSLLWGIVILVAMGIILSRLEAQTVLSLTSASSSRRSWAYGLIAVAPTFTVIVFGVSRSIEWISMQQGVDVGELRSEIFDSLLLVATVVPASIIVLVLYISGFAKGLLRRLGLASYAIPGVVVGSTIIYFFGAAVPLLVLLVCGITFRYFGLMIQSVSVAEQGNRKYIEVVDLYVRNWFLRFTTKTKLMISSITIGLSLIVLDVLRELPVSMVLQPMDFQTLAMRMNYIARTENVTLLGFHSLVLLGLGVIFSLVVIGVTYGQNTKSKR